MMSARIVDVARVNVKAHIEAMPNVTDKYINIFWLYFAEAMYLCIYYVPK